MAFVNPTVADFQNYFTRDFPYGVTDDTVMDSDIVRALNDASVNFNPCLFGYQNVYTTAYLLLAAHFLVMNLRASSQGISGKYTWLLNSKSAGSVSAGMTIPDRILENPELAMLSQTNYGAQYLFMILPQLAGPFGIAYGRTLA